MAVYTFEKLPISWSELHTDAIQIERAQNVEETEKAAWARFFRERQEACSHQLADQSVCCKSVLKQSAEYLRIVYDLTTRLKSAPEEKLQKFLDLVEATDTDGDSQLNLLLWEVFKYKAEIFGQLAGYVFNGRFPEKLLNRQNKYCQTSLIVAILAGVDASLIRALVVLGADYSSARKFTDNRKDLEGVFEAPLSLDEETQLLRIAQLQDSSS
jgi:hypothetical protein